MDIAQSVMKIIHSDFIFEVSSEYAYPSSRTSLIYPVAEKVP